MAKITGIKKMVHKRQRPYGPLTPILSRRERMRRMGRSAAFRRLTGLYAPLRRSQDNPRLCLGSFNSE